MSDFDLRRDVLFVGRGTSPVSYYRCVMPAEALGCDWIGAFGEPPKLGFANGLCRGEDGNRHQVMPDLFKYRAIVLQQPCTKAWRELIVALQEQGIKVFFEIDDYVHGIPKVEDHDFREVFDKKLLWEYEQTMKVCDALICSTDVIATHYRHFNRRTFVCRNGIDLKRYDLTVPPRGTVNIGWAGATGHIQTLIPWLVQVAHIMAMRPHVCYISIGHPHAKAIQDKFGVNRAVVVPWCQIEQYPAAMTMMDIGLAPGGRGEWRMAKSDLRFLEAGALGIPLVADPRVYGEIEDGVTGFTATNPLEAAEKLLALVDNKKLRTVVGDNARRHVRHNRDIKVMARFWEAAIREVVDDG